MSISSTTYRNNYTGPSGSVFEYSFRILDDDQLLVTVRDSVGTETTLVKTTDYTVASVGASTGSITLVNASQAWLTGGNLSTGYKMSIVRNVPLTQPTDIRNQGTFYPETHEDAFDRGVMQAQQQQDTLDRGVRLPVTVDPSAFDPEVPASIVGQAGAILQVNSDGDGWTVGASTVVGTTVTPFMETVLDDLNAAAARTTLGALSSAALAVDTANLADLSVTDAKLAANSVITSKILDANVTAAKLAEAVYDVVDFYCGASAGGNDTYAVAPSPAFTSYVTGMKLSFKADVANTGACTLNVNSLGAKSIKVFTNGVVADPADNSISAASMVTVQYDGTQFILLSAGVSSGTRLIGVYAPSAASTLDITGLTAGTRYRLVWNFTWNTADGFLLGKFNNDAGSNYNATVIETILSGSGTAGSATSAYYPLSVSAFDAGATCFGSFEFQAMPGTLTKASVLGMSGGIKTASTAMVSNYFALYTGASNVTQVNLYTTAGTFTGSALLYALGA